MTAPLIFVSAAAALSLVFAFVSRRRTAGLQKLLADASIRMEVAQRHLNQMEQKLKKIKKKIDRARYEQKN